MIRRKTVFVVGAGASHELGFPLGKALISDVAKSLKFNWNGSSQSPNNLEAWRGVETLCHRAGGQISDYVSACSRVGQAAALGRSIDNIIHQHRDDKLFVQCAKIGIAHRILECERKSPLHHDQDESFIRLNEVAETWLGSFVQALVIDNEKSSLPNIFDNVSIISFNYDRAILRFLPFGLATQFSMTRGEAEEACRRLTVFHPYGSLGDLTWQNAAHSVPFGRNMPHELPEIANNLRTFTEQRDVGSSLDDMQRRLKEANQIFFLGFGYIEQNLDLLLGDRAGFSAISVAGSAMGLTSSDMAIIPKQLHFLFGKNVFNAETNLINMTCVDFFRDQFRAITSHE